MTIKYGPDGNILSKTGVGDYCYDAAIRPHAVIGVTNQKGIIPSAALETTYGDLNKINMISNGTYETTFSYGPDLQRWCTVEKKNDTDYRTIHYAPGIERVTLGGVTRTFFYLGHGVIVMQQGSTYIPLLTVTDHQDTIVWLVDATDTWQFDANYDAWGQQTVAKNNLGFRRGYTGHEMLPEYGLINMRSARRDALLAKNGRLYDPLLGRFLSPDRSALCDAFVTTWRKNYVQQPDNSQSFNRYSYCLNNPLKYTDPDGELFGIDDIVFIAAMAYIGGVQANFSHSVNNSSNPFNPADWNWGSAGTYIGVGLGALNGAGVSTSVAGMLTNGALHAAGNVVLNGITNITEHRGFFSQWGLSAATGFLEGAVEGYQLAKKNGENYWWGGEPKYNRTQWSFVNSDKPDYVISMHVGNGGNMNPNDCVQTTLYEIDQKKDGGHTYQTFYDRVKRIYTPEGTTISTEQLEQLLKEYFVVENITRKSNNLFHPEFMSEVAKSNGVITVHFTKPGHADNIRTLRVFVRAPEKNVITFRQSQFNANEFRFNYKNGVSGIFRIM